jgi:hypothetical protein
MILKLKDSSERSKFWVFDNVKKISYSYLEASNKKEFSSAGQLLLLKSSEEDDSQKKIHYVQFIFRQKDSDEEYVVRTNNDAYLLNDNGQTIEKIK